MTTISRRLGAKWLNSRFQFPPPAILQTPEAIGFLGRAAETASAGPREPTNRDLRWTARSERVLASLLPFVYSKPFAIMTVPATLSPEQKDTALNDSPTIAPSEINDVDVKTSTSESDLRHLEDLKVSDDELFGSLTYNQLSLYEKKSCVPALANSRKKTFSADAAHCVYRVLVRSVRCAADSHSSTDALLPWQINREFDRMVRNDALALWHVTLVEEKADPLSSLPECCFALRFGTLPGAYISSQTPAAAALPPSARLLTFDRSRSGAFSSCAASAISSISAGRKSLVSSRDRSSRYAAP